MVYTVEKVWDVYNFYKTNTETSVLWEEVQIKKLCKTKTVASVNSDILKLNTLKTKRIAEHNSWIANLDRDIAKQQEFLSLMI